MITFSRKGYQGKDGHPILNRYPIKKGGDQRTPTRDKRKGQLDYEITMDEIKLGGGGGGVGGWVGWGGGLHLT